MSKSVGTTLHIHFATIILHSTRQRSELISRWRVAMRVQEFDATFRLANATPFPLTMISGGRIFLMNRKLSRLLYRPADAMGSAGPSTCVP